MTHMLAFHWFMKSSHSTRIVLRLSRNILSQFSCFFIFIFVPAFSLLINSDFIFFSKDSAADRKKTDEPTPDDDTQEAKSEVKESDEDTEEQNDGEVKVNGDTFASYQTKNGLL